MKRSTKAMLKRCKERRIATFTLARGTHPVPSFNQVMQRYRGMRKHTAQQEQQRA